MASTVKEATDERAGRAKGLRVLVVEDDPGALAATVEMLQLLGHWAAGVGSAETAKDRFLDGAFDVLLTDIGLPALSGMDLVESLHVRNRLQHPKTWRAVSIPGICINSAAKTRIH